MTNNLPAPPIPSDVDLRTFDDMPLDVRALRDSDTAMIVSDRGFRAAVMLWCAAWHQIPAGSLPNDPRKLAHMAGCGRDLRAWRHISMEALRGFYEASDGRLYHSYICAKARKAWARKNEQVQKANKGWDKRKALKGNKTGSAPASAQSNAHDLPQHRHSSTGGNAPAMPLNRGDTSPPISTPNGATSGSGVGPMAQPSRPMPLADPEVDVGNGVILAINSHGICDLVTAPRDAKIPNFTTVEAKALRAKALERPPDAERTDAA